MSNLYIEQRIANDKKSEILAYVLWFFLGLFGVHRMYLGRWATGMTMLVLAVIVAAIGWIPILGWIPAAVLFVWWALDIFLTHEMISEDVRQMRRALGSEIS